MASLKDTLWFEKYRPKTLSEYVFQDTRQQEKVSEWIEQQSIPHMLLSGTQGAGKTTLALILINEMKLDPSDVLIINASDENSVDTVRDKIKGFVSSTAMGDFKIILLEEADYLTINGQAVMRRLMEEFSDNARFILTCNYLHKIIPAIRSRCSTATFQFKAVDKNDVAEYIIKILASEKISFDLNLVDQYIDIGYPDIRSIVGSVQQQTINNVLLPPQSGASGIDDYKISLLDLIEKDNWMNVRTVICDNVQREEYEDVYRFMYENINNATKFKNKDKWEEAILVIADHLYKHTAVADAEINFAAMCIRLGQL